MEETVVGWAAGGSAEQILKTTGRCHQKDEWNERNEWNARYGLL